MLLRELQECIFLDCIILFQYAYAMDLEHMSWRMFLIRLIEIIFIVNIALLDILAVQSFPHFTANVSTMRNIPTLPPAKPTLIKTSQMISPQPTIVQTVISQTSGIKEVYIPLGTGETTASSWSNVPGALAAIDSSKYPGFKQVTFDANITVPTANEIVWIRLYDMTDKHPVWNSEMSMDTPTQFISIPISLESGNKLYQVQMYTQLQYLATLNLARVHITLN